MNGFVRWLRQVGYRMRCGLQRFMTGRYGQLDKLNSLLLWIGVIVVLVSMFLPTGVLTLVFPLISYGLLGSLVGLYATVGIVLAILVFLKVLK